MHEQFTFMCTLQLKVHNCLVHYTNFSIQSHYGYHDCYQICTVLYTWVQGGNTTRAVKINYVDSIHLTNS